MAIDIHTHLIPAMAAHAAAMAGLRPEPGGLRSPGGTMIGPETLYDVSALVRWLARASLDECVVSIPPPLFRQSLPAAAAHRWVRHLNDALLAAVAEHDQVHVFGYVPLEHPEVALEETARLADDDAVVGLAAAAGGRSRALDDDALAPWWRLCAASELPVLLHPGHAEDPRLRPHYLTNLLGNPSETGLAAAQLVFGGVLETHPSLRVALTHCGGVVPAVAGRWRRGAATSRPGVRIGPAQVDVALRRLWVDSLAHDAQTLRAAREIVGADHVLLGSDWPFPMGSEDPLADVQTIGASWAVQVGSENAESFLGERVRRHRNRRSVAEVEE